MGISHPYLAILASIAFISIVIAMFSLFLYIVDQVNKTPVLGVYADAYIDYSGGVNITIAIEHKRGEIVKINNILLFSENDVISIEDLGNSKFVAMSSCRDGYVHPGGVCRVVLGFPPGVFTENKLYKGLVIFNKGSYPIAFTPVKPLIEYLKTPYYPVILQTTPYITACKGLELLDIGLQANVSEDFSDTTIPQGWVAIPQNSWSIINGMLKGVDVGEGLLGTSISYYANVSISRNILVYVRTSLSSEGIEMYRRWGVALYLKDPRQQIITVFSLNTSGYAEVVVYRWLKDGVEREVVRFVPVGINVKDSWFTIAMNANCDKEKCLIGGSVYDDHYNVISSMEIVEIRFPEELNSDYDVYVGVFVDGVEALFDDFIVYIGVKPLNIINIVNVPRGYIVELRNSYGELIDIGESLEGYVKLSIPLPKVDKGGKIIVLYPHPYKNLTCLEYLIPRTVFGSSTLKLVTTTVNTTLYYDGMAASVSINIGSPETILGVLPLSVVNNVNESYIVIPKPVSAITTDNTLIYIHIVNSTYISKPAILINGSILSTEDIFVLNPRNTAFIYMKIRLQNIEEKLRLNIALKMCITSSIQEFDKAICFEYPVLIELIKS